jgi:transcriptional regulator with XRE-family HTH domain
MTRETRGGTTKPARPLPRNESPEFYEGLGRAIKVARTAMGLERKELAELAGVSYAYLSDIETGRGRPGSRSFLAIAEALQRSPSELMREAEIYRARISGEEVEPQRLPGSSPDSEIQARMARMSEAAPSPAARRWFHAGRMLAEAEMDLATEETVRLTGSPEDFGGETPQEELHRLVDGLSPEDAEVVLALVRRLRSSS